MRPSSGTVRRARPLLGTLVEIRIGSNAPDATRAIERAFATIERVHRAMSVQESTSDIARLRSGYWCALDAWTRRVLDRAEEIRLASGGLFDWRACGYSLDGIAKGFAVDRAVQSLENAGIPAGVVNAGGDLRVFGDGLEEIYIRLPHRPDELVRIGALRNAAIATSARAGLVDPLSPGGRLPAPGATVIAADCMTADALTKPCMLEPMRAGEFAERFGARAIVL
jgi:thiamine biosynthesis lipoprotein